jgi:hypothetical protein
LAVDFHRFFYCFNAPTLIPGNVFALIYHVTHVRMVESAIWTQKFLGIKGIIM